MVINFKIFWKKIIILLVTCCICLNTCKAKKKDSSSSKSSSSDSSSSKSSSSESSSSEFSESEKFHFPPKTSDGQDGTNPLLSKHHLKIHNNFVPLLFPTEIPDHILRVTYNGLTFRNFSYHNQTIDADLGGRLRVRDTLEEPEIDWLEEPGNFYTAMMLDVDAPSFKNPVHRSWLHWLIVNIPDYHYKQGDVIAEYIGPWPLEGTGKHRYVLIIYEQPEKLQFDEPFLPRGNFVHRRKFNHYQFKKKYNLSEAIATNFFTAKYSYAVDRHYKQYLTPENIN
ncbi:phosphatidylethanolamine-binding protein 2-like [Lycorma delicatula]|uniref:phosphatidylethanolamine-binding protein 2-like n=1 Tax=Lycorma delicatula TaxID=130591 RepID=UPI003F517598